MLELYHWEPALCSAPPLICLKEKGLDFHGRYVDLHGLEQGAQPFLQLNPKGQVPVLVHDGRVITEATLMLQYLDAAFAQPALAPAGAADRYRMQVWLKQVDEYLAPAVSLLGWHRYARTLLRGRDQAQLRQGLARLPPERQAPWRAALEDSWPEDQLEAARTSLQLRVPLLEQALAGAPWLAGADYSLADIAVFALVDALPAVLPEVLDGHRTPRTLDWLRRVRERPAVREALGKARTDRLQEAFAPGPEASRWG